MKTTFKELQNAAEKFHSVREEIRKEISTLNPVELVTPINLTEQKKLWIENAKCGIFKNPHFVYDVRKLKKAAVHQDALFDLRQYLISIAPEDEVEKFVWKLLFKAVNDGLDTVDLAIAMLDKDDEAAGEAIRSKYGLPTKEIVKEAEKVAEEIRRRGTLAEEFEGKSYEFEDPEDERLLVEEKFNAEEIKYFFEWAMNRYDDRLAWPVIIEENCSAIDVRDKSSYGHPVIAIPASREVNGFKLAELIGHEIECHWRNSVNAELIGALKLDDELAYEGLAKVKDNLFDRYYLKKDATPTPYYIIAESLALDCKSFAETSERIFHLLPRKEPNLVTKAWNNTYRAYRGISNTLNLDGYAFTKDRAYFEGYSYAKALDRHGYFEYLSFGLDRLTIKDLIEMTSPYDLEQSAILMDKHIQHQSIEKILKYIKNSQDDGLPVPVTA